MHSDRRPRLTPAMADVRRAVRKALAMQAGPVLVALSGGADSLALAAATAFEAPRAGLRAGAVIVDHGLQAGSADAAAQAAQAARELGLDPVLVRAVVVAGDGSGPESAARAARYRAFEEAMRDTGATHVLLGHTLDDQAETVLLGLARGSGPTSLQGMSSVTGPYLRPLLGIRRATTQQYCRDAGLSPWADPQNGDPRYARVRVRQRVLPTLEQELGPGVAEALARTAEQLREDADALDALVLEVIEEICEPAEGGIAVSVGALAANPPALRQRIIRFVVESEFGVTLSRAQTLAAVRLVTDWHGQKGVDLPGVRVERQNGLLVFRVTRAVAADH
ncbi:tRNA lysidine(34) synthetase TilS [Cryobacterium tepidiphilum]|uniref:tRNA(Ile)-lysidine synthase n=1 Tax=Cryobacterium tepidiphilum TaxID=2486026 RepID=A0A3M8LSC0_9MICO|nr:tRNA lysidine(34) synthetase TilS [Cryobacterium tepidiphilum]RNE67388.1 tRNA lysidine(34) synthetase TilS [Cryobacterium tepidiphilum]